MLELVLKIAPEIFALILIFFDRFFEVNYHAKIANTAKKGFENFLKSEDIVLANCQTKLENIKRSIEIESKLFNAKNKVFVPGTVCIVSFISYSVHMKIDKNIIMLILLFYTIIYVFDLYNFNNAELNNFLGKKKLHFSLVCLLTLSNLLIKILL
jgi:hypothetical protein